MARSREQHREYMREYRARKRAEKNGGVAASEAVTPPSVTPDPPTPPAHSSRHSDAVDRMLRETGLDRLDEEMPLVEMLRELASELDAEPMARTRQQYLAALRDARRVLAAAPGSAVPSRSEKEDPETVTPVAEVTPPAADVEPEVADFESFRRAKGGSSAG